MEEMEGQITVLEVPHKQVQVGLQKEQDQDEQVLEAVVMIFHQAWPLHLLAAALLEPHKLVMEVEVSFCHLLKLTNAYKYECY